MNGTAGKAQRKVDPTQSGGGSPLRLGNGQSTPTAGGLNAIAPPLGSLATMLQGYCSLIQLYNPYKGRVLSEKAAAWSPNIFFSACHIMWEA